MPKQIHVEYDKESLEQIKPLKEGATYKTSSPTEGGHRALSWNSVPFPSEQPFYSIYVLFHLGTIPLDLMEQLKEHSEESV